MAYLIFKLALLCYICLLVFILIDLGDANSPEMCQNKHARQRRYLSFKNSSKFFIRLNFKANMVAWTQIFAQALGFRVNWDDPPDTFHPYHHLYRRTVFTHLESLFERNGLNGYYCVKRAICEMDTSSPRSIYEKILKMVFRRQSSATDYWHNKTNAVDCLLSINNCPISFMGISQYTDI